jgi:hypothetical protein
MYDASTSFRTLITTNFQLNRALSLTTATPYFFSQSSRLQLDLRLLSSSSLSTVLADVGSLLVPVVGRRVSGGGLRH